jgi:hypothetical protein
MGGRSFENSSLIVIVLRERSYACRYRIAVITHAGCDASEVRPYVSYVVNGFLTLTHNTTARTTRRSGCPHRRV